MKQICHPHLLCFGWHHGMALEQLNCSLLNETEVEVVLLESSSCVLVTCGCNLVCFEVEIIETHTW